MLDVVVAQNGDAGEVAIAVGTEGTLLRSDDGGVSYAKIETPTRESLVQVLVERKQGSILVIGSKGTMLRSVDRGRTFVTVHVGTDSDLNAIAQSETGTIVVIGDRGVALSSSDQGEHFTLENTGRTPLLTELVALPGQLGVFVAAGDQGSISLRDGSGRWIAVDAPSPTFVTALESLGDGSLLAGLADGIVLRSSDKGAHWQQTFGSRDKNYVIRFVSSPDGAVVMARLRNRTLATSQDGGRTFSLVDLPGAKSPTALIWLPGSGFVGATNDGGTVRSDPGGRVWSHTTSSETMRATKLAVITKAGTVLAVGESGFIGRLAPAAVRFNVIAPDLGGLVRALAQASDTNTIVGVGFEATIVRSVDGGRTFERRRVPLAATAELGALAYDPDHSSFIAATTTGAVYRSQDDGKTFRKSVELGVEVTGLSFLGNGRVLALCAKQGARLSKDGGRTFGRPVAGLAGTLRYAARGCKPGSVLAVGDGGALFRSTTGATSFEELVSTVTTTLRSFACEPGSDRTWIVGDQGTLLRWEDGTAELRRVLLPTDENLFALGHSDDGEVFFVGGNGGTLLRSTDRGQSFVSVATGSRQTVRITAFIPGIGEFVVGGVGGLLMLTKHRTVAQQFSGRFEGRFDHVLFHAPTQSIVVGGDRLLRLTMP